MKQIILITTFFILSSINAKAQFFDDNLAVQTPTTDLYDSGMMQGYLNSMRDLTRQRQYENDMLERRINAQHSQYIDYVNKVIYANNNNIPKDVIYYSNIALQYDFTDASGVLYMCRGNAYVQLNDLREAATQYTIAYNYGYPDAKSALDWVNQELRKR